MFNSTIWSNDIFSLSGSSDVLPNMDMYVWNNKPTRNLDIIISCQFVAPEGPSSSRAHLANPDSALQRSACWSFCVGHRGRRARHCKQPDRRRAIGERALWQLGCKDARDARPERDRVCRVRPSAYHRARSAVPGRERVRRAQSRAPVIPRSLWDRCAILSKRLLCGY